MYLISFAAYGLFGGCLFIWGCMTVAQYFNEKARVSNEKARAENYRIKALSDELDAWFVKNRMER